MFCRNVLLSLACFPDSLSWCCKLALYLTNNILRKFGVVMIGTNWNGSVASFVVSVFERSAPSKIIELAVAWISVKVSAFHSTWTRTDKGFENDGVQRFHYPATAGSQADETIAVLRWTASNLFDLSIWNPLGSVAFSASRAWTALAKSGVHLSGSGCEVVREAWNFATIGNATKINNRHGVTLHNCAVFRKPFGVMTRAAFVII